MRWTMIKLVHSFSTHFHNLWVNSKLLWSKLTKEESSTRDLLIICLNFKQISLISKLSISCKCRTSWPRDNNRYSIMEESIRSRCLYKEPELSILKVINPALLCNQWAKDGAAIQGSQQWVKSIKAIPKDSNQVDRCNQGGGANQSIQHGVSQGRSSTASSHRVCLQASGVSNLWMDNNLHRSEINKVKVCFLWIGI